MLNSTAFLDGFETTKCHSYRVTKHKSPRGSYRNFVTGKALTMLIILKVKLRCILLEIQDHEFLNIGHQPLSVSNSIFTQYKVLEESYTFSGYG